ncbi:MAG TPA: putative toxin-antitoxin system toxin component, PIN family [Longimicrobiaceae bacterium]|nr:putative toxin-antitoxin system toxin component, PIN family [Longimicrobiaceae bacterium]
MRVFLDTNVLVSAFATRGLCRDVLQLVLAEHDLLTGDVVLAELERVLATKFKMPPDRVREVIESLDDAHVEPRPESVGSLAVRDPDDAWVLASAIAARADVLVTGDPDLLVLADAVPQLNIVNPRGFWDLQRQA